MPKTDAMRLRLQPQEKQGFEEAAELAGVALSAWVRERLRKAAAKELEAAGREIPFYRLGDTSDGAGVEADEVGDMLNARKTNIGLEANALDHKGSQRDSSDGTEADSKASPQIGSPPAGLPGFGPPSP
jgi:hypothetical protein